MAKRRSEIILILLILFILGIVFYYVDISFKNPQEVQEYINGFGVYGPLVVIGLIILEVIIAPIPGAIIAIASGAAFGAFKGTIYSWIGNVIGTMIAFLLSRYFGRPLVQRLVKQDKLEYYDKFFRERGVYGLWIAYIFPVFPSDIISFVTGLSNLRFRTFFIIVSIGYLPNMLLLNYFGDSIINYGLGLTTIIFGAFLGLIFLFGLVLTFPLKKT